VGAVESCWFRLMVSFFLRKLALPLGLTAWLFFAGSAGVFAIENPSASLEKIGLNPKLAQQVDLSLEFTNSEGVKTTLESLIRPDKPSIVVPVYYRCPRLCGLLMSGFVDLLRDFPLQIGKDFQIIVVSFAPTETPKEAAGEKERYAEMLGLSVEQRLSFHFLVGTGDNVSALMRQIGFNYLPDGVDFAHSAGLILLTPGGAVAQYFTGIEFSAFDVRLALVEASQGKIGSALDHVMLFCFRFDPTKGKYTWVTMGALRIGGAISIVLLGGLILLLVIRERRARRKLLKA
jgi:protein SCO1/2